MAKKIAARYLVNVQVPQIWQPPKGMKQVYETSFYATVPGGMGFTEARLTRNFIHSGLAVGNLANMRIFVANVNTPNVPMRNAGYYPPEK